MSETDHDFFGIALAHEICHYLGLDHDTGADNLMEAHGGAAPHNLTWNQWNTVIGHGMMKWLA
jgi:predicted Zn-dependent protease with MMP-like domain